MKSPLLLNKIATSVVIGALGFGLSACETTKLLRAEKEAAAIVCNKVEEPPREPLGTVTFFPLPPGSMSPGGVPLVAGVTADGMVTIIDNMSKLQKRENKWQVRTEAVNTCLETDAKQKVDRQ